MTSLQVLDFRPPPWGCAGEILFRGWASLTELRRNPRKDLHLSVLARVYTCRAPLLVVARLPSIDLVRNHVVVQLAGRAVYTIGVIAMS